jgi:hypothetical protein
MFEQKKGYGEEIFRDICNEIVAQSGKGGEEEEEEE